MGPQHRVTKQMPSETVTLGAAIHGQASQHGGDRLGHVPPGTTGRFASMERTDRQRVVPDHPVAASCDECADRSRTLRAALDRPSAATPADEDFDHGH